VARPVHQEGTRLLACLTDLSLLGRLASSPGRGSITDFCRCLECHSAKDLVVQALCDVNSSFV
jgi:hypothetical protein